MTDKPDVSQYSIRTYIYVLIALVLLVMSVIAAAIYWQLNKSDIVERTANNYHLFTMINCNRIHEELERITYHIYERTEQEILHPEYGSGDIADLNTSFLLIQEKFSAIKELQQRYEHRKYVQVLDNTDNMLSRLLSIYTETEPNAESDLNDFTQTLSQLSIYLEQLEQLHANAYQEIMSELITERPVAFRNILLFLSIPVIIGILLIIKTLKLIRSAESELIRHRRHLKELVEERTRELSESNDNLIQEIFLRRKVENDLRDATKEIEKWNRELEARVKEKTDELERSRYLLIQSEKLSAMGELAGGLAHELNSPLAGLVPMLEIHRKREQKGSKASEEIDAMLKAALHMAKIVKDFCVFARRSNSDFRTLSLCELIEDTLSFSAVRMNQKSINIKKELSDRLPSVLGEKTELQQVVLNMITNASDAMDEGGVLLIATDISEDSKQVIMEFTDNGAGIAEENLTKIFDPFFTTKKEGEGTGLGLSLSYGIIKNHNGEITVESTPGMGSKFRICLPAIENNHA